MLNRKVSPMDPMLMKAWNKGREAGYQAATDVFHNFLMERMNSLVNVPGIGEKTAEKVHLHFIEYLEGKDNQ